MKSLIQQHKLALQQVLRRMHQKLSSTLMMCAVIGVTLCLPGVMYVVVDNLRTFSGHIQSEPRVSLFLKQDITTPQKQSIEQHLSQHPRVERFHYVSKETAWHEMLQNPSTASVATHLETNPLPDAFFVTPNSNEPSQIDALKNEAQTWDGVELAQIDANWIKRLHALLALGEKAVWLLIVLLSFALIAIIGNTIRLQILTQREEIEVSQLIGATQHFIRRPFLYAGVLYGLGGGLAAWGLLMTIIHVFNVSIADLATLYGSDFRLAQPDWRVNLSILGCAVAIGYTSAYAYVSKAMRQHFA